MSPRCLLRPSRPRTWRLPERPALVDTAASRSEPVRAATRWGHPVLSGDRACGWVFGGWSFSPLHGKGRQAENSSSTPADSNGRLLGFVFCVFCDRSVTYVILSARSAHALGPRRAPGVGDVQGRPPRHFWRHLPSGATCPLLSGASLSRSFKSHLLLNCDLSKTSLFETVGEQ